MQLRKICNHPYLFDMPEQESDLDFEQFSAAAANPQNTDANTRTSEQGEVALRLPDIVASSGKMLMLERLLPRLFAGGHKVLIFSQMTRMLDILADWFEFIKGWRFCRIDGNVTIDSRRQQVCASFFQYFFPLYITCLFV